MTQEDKDLLFKDLCARLPYGVIVKYWSREGDGDVKVGFGNIGYVFQLGNGWWKECKPYLRLLSSMAEEEKEFILRYGYGGNHIPYKEIDFYNAHHFDYHGLIPAGLALPATEGMYTF